MLKKRIIPCLDIKNGRAVKGVNFINLKDAGDPVELAKRYSLEGADELIFLDITATIENRKTRLELIEKIAEEINIPFTVGGGINSLEDAKLLIKSGADKISINSAAIKNPRIISDIANQFGSQCVVVAIDTKSNNNKWMVYLNGGRISAQIETKWWAKEVENLGAGEILLTSMIADGTKNGFDLEITNLVSTHVSIPVIASGGAGKKEHFEELFKKSNVSAALAASIFHYNEISINDLKKYLSINNIPIRWA